MRGIADAFQFIMCPAYNGVTRIQPNYSCGFSHLLGVLESIQGKKTFVKQLSENLSPTVLNSIHRSLQSSSFQFITIACPSSSYSRSSKKKMYQCPLVQTSGPWPLPLSWQSWFPHGLTLFICISAGPLINLFKMSSSTPHCFSYLLLLIPITLNLDL